jgi:pyrroloquinoline quinone biosynthesis protein B
VISAAVPTAADSPYVVVLGIAQDGGVPHALCTKGCCEEAFADPAKRKRVACLGIVDPAEGKCWLVDATPDLPVQLRALQDTGGDTPPELAGVLLTHAHIGHYTGLMFLGREVSGTQNVSVYAMPRMQKVLSNGAPWDQLVKLENIRLEGLQSGNPTKLSERIEITPLSVPHRDEYSETVGFVIKGPERSLVFIPDIDKWGLWSMEITGVIRAHDYAFLDASFYADGEIPNRAMSEIPHPFIVESMETFSILTPEERARVHFIHLNHTNPVLREDSDARKHVEGAGYNVAKRGQRVSL